MLAAGVGCFGLAGLVSGYLPIAHLSKIPIQEVDEIVPEPSYEFQGLAKRYPEQFKKYYGEVNPRASARRSASGGTPTSPRPAGTATRSTSARSPTRTPLRQGVLCR
jgi:hypothetical protein